MKECEASLSKKEKSTYLCDIKTDQHFVSPNFAKYWNRWTHVYPIIHFCVLIVIWNCLYLSLEVDIKLIFPNKQKQTPEAPN